MTAERQQVDAVEEALLELEAAETAQVFRRTPVDAERLLSDAGRSAGFGGARLLRHVMPLAAAVVVVVGIGVWMLAVDFASFRGPEQLAGGVASGPDVESVATIQRCLNGPAEEVLPGCTDFDFDDDGSVTLADFSAYQVAYADVTR